MSETKDLPPTCPGCGEPKTYVETFEIAGEPGGYFCTTEGCGYD